MRRSIQLVAMDIDGTLLGKTKELSTYTKNVLKEAGKAGIHLVIATGRAFQAIPRRNVLCDHFERKQCFSFVRSETCLWKGSGSTSGRAIA